LAGRSSLLKWEAANYRLGDGPTDREVEALYCHAISAKRYCLFNLGRESRPVLRKASAHGLGHLRPPYEEAKSPADIPPPATPLHEVGVERWQYDLWYRIVSAALAGHPDQVDLTDLPGLDRPAVSRYAATTPQLLGWFDRYNAARPYAEQVRPFNFLLAYQTDRLAALERLYDEAMAVSSELERTEIAQEEWRDFRMAILAAGGIRDGADWSRQAIPRSVRRSHGLPVDEMADTLGYPSDSDFISHVQDVYQAARLRRSKPRLSLQLPRVVAPFDKDLEAAAGRCFDRETGEPVDRALLKTYRQALAQYHLHPESKFLGGGYLDRGVTRRRHLIASSVECIGKEANRWEEQAHLGQDETAQIVYGVDPEAAQEAMGRLREELRKYPVREAARTAGMATRTVQKVRNGTTAVRPSTLARIQKAVERLSGAVRRASQSDR
jgi:hypothetical protein